MTETFDAIVLGSGVVGASTAFHLAKLGGLKVCVVERGELCSGGTAKSCAIVRSHYSVPSNTALTLASLEIFSDFNDCLEDDDAESGFVNSGYLILAPEGGLAGKMRANLAMQSDVGAETFELSPAEALERHPFLALDDVALIGYEPRSGYADPYLTTSSFLRAARARGAVVKTGCAAERLLLDGGRVTGVATPRGELRAGIVVSALGPWTRGLTDPLGLEIPLEISRHTVLTFKGNAPYGRDLPVVKDLTTANKMYFRPATGGVVLVGTGDHGDPLAAADDMDENLDDDFILLQGGQLARRLAGFEEAVPTASWVGAYDITPDWNPVLGPVSGIEGLTLAYGFSGHGFKLAPALGKVLAQSVLGLAQDVDLAPYRLGRFAEGRLLTGAYGVGSIS
ncbi:MAG: FAD-binding oxidoreductase [Rhodospirillales bacterium]|nr:FAD-binding oxidoreductase [Rhodospirillales bacterium]MDH3912703.1 FAD-binding oxidoreductase [Rhodospirillales bacterium]MDH3918548.1 FAD-binding oxidoreductase [Rhodospirillales bacterium]MDH3968327.1 FAD-binding oxidoreductase [Rhodospirillales bacterium]